MVKKILDIALKIVLGIFVFYLVLGFVIIPLVLTWGIQAQGAKILKTPVRVKGVSFNPVLLDLSIKGVEVLDSQKKSILGFDKFRVNVSFLGLLKKTYRIEAIELDGLKVNVELLANGHINLLDLIPPSAPVQDGTKQTKATSQPLPLIIIDRIILSKGSIRFTDLSVNPHFSTALNQMNLQLTGISTKPDSQVKVNFDAKLDDKGTVATEALIAPFATPLQLETSFTMSNYALEVLTPYIGKYAGRGLKDGKLDLKMDYRVADNKLNASHKVLVQRFEFGQKIESKDVLPLPFGLAVALLEDPQGRINISLPVKGDMSNPEFEYFHLIGQVIRNFFMKLITKPFTFLATMIGSDSGTEEMGTIRFLPGQSTLSDAEQEKMKILVKGLKERPKLNLEINGSYDPQPDWKAIKTDVLKKDYSQLRKDSLRTEIWIYERLYERRFGIRQLWALAKKYRSKEGVLDEAKLQEDIKRQLIEDAPPDEMALSLLAETRAQIVYDFIVSSGFDPKRLSIGKPQAVQSSMGFIPLEFILTVFDSTAAH